MRTLLLVAMTGFALSSALPALAATTPAKPMTASHSLYKTACTRLETKFDKVQSNGDMGKLLPGAKYLRNLGGTLCQDGQYANGIATLRNALATVKAGHLTTTSGTTTGVGEETTTG